MIGRVVVVEKVAAAVMQGVSSMEPQPKRRLRLGPGHMHQKWYITADGRVHRHVLPHRRRQRAGTRLAAGDACRGAADHRGGSQGRAVPLAAGDAPGAQDGAELRSSMPDGIARVFFSIWNDRIVALHGFVKKSQKTPDNELDTANRRLANFKRNST